MHLLALAGLLILLSSCAAEYTLPDYPEALALPAPADLPQSEAEVPDGIAPLGRGINFGNALEAPREGEWGVIIQPHYFNLIRTAGFHTVRIPIRWSAHAQAASPYQIEQEFFERIDWVIDSSLRSGLNAVINVHHYEEIFEDPDGHARRFLSLWKQIARRYQNYPNGLVFELLNEPHASLNARKWNELFPLAVRAIRETNPRRLVIVGGPDWSSAGSLSGLRLPAEKDNLVVTFHLYEPFQFTHQGADWVAGSDAWLGTRWLGSEADRSYLIGRFDAVSRWAHANGIRLWMGEFGSQKKQIEPEDRLRWTGFVIEEAEKRGIGWAYWEFGSHFAVYDRLKGEWDAELLAVMMR